MKVPSLAAAAAALSIVVGSALAQSSEADFLKRFDNSFAGGGKVRTAANGSPYNVKCKVVGNSTASTVDINGTCTAMAVVSRKIGASLKVDANGRYTGTYVGSKIGPAALSGRRKGDFVVLNVTWPKPVNGDTQATMTITHTGSGFSFAVDDQSTPGGSNVRMTDITLQR